MDNPVSIVKSQLNVGTILKTAVGLIVLFAILDLAGLTNWILFPVTTAKAKLARA